MVKLGHAAIDGANIKASASEQKAISSERTKEVEVAGFTAPARAAAAPSRS